MAFSRVLSMAKEEEEDALKLGAIGAGESSRKTRLDGMVSVSVGPHCLFGVRSTCAVARIFGVIAGFVMWGFRSRRCMMTLVLDGIVIAFSDSMRLRNIREMRWWTWRLRKVLRRGLE